MPSLLPINLLHKFLEVEDILSRSNILVVLLVILLKVVIHHMEVDLEALVEEDLEVWIQRC